MASTGNISDETCTTYVISLPCSNSSTLVFTGQSKHAGKQEVEAILALEESVKDHQQRIHDLEDQLASPGQLDVTEIRTEISESRASRTRLTETVRRKKAALGVGQRAALKKLKDSVFLQIRMNARTIKTRLRDRLRQRKFELERLERSYRQVVNGESQVISDSLLTHKCVSFTENKLVNHKQSSVKRREPGILKLAKTYNDHCEKMAALVRQREAPRNALLPQPIDPRKLFLLDVDDDIWQDTGLDDDDKLPPWLTNQDVHIGIKSLLEHDRCLEEESRLQKERTAMQAWFREEWDVLKIAQEANSAYLFPIVASCLFMNSE
jgi:hypothetical protein